MAASAAYRPSPQVCCSGGLSSENTQDDHGEAEGKVFVRSVSIVATTLPCSRRLERTVSGAAGKQSSIDDSTSDWEWTASIFTFVQISNRLDIDKSIDTHYGRAIVKLARTAVGNSQCVSRSRRRRSKMSEKRAVMFVVCGVFIMAAGSVFAQGLLNLPAIPVYTAHGDWGQGIYSTLDITLSGVPSS